MKRTALITGAAGGIGMASVDIFASAGWQIIAVDRKPFGEQRFPVDARQVDVSDPAAIQALMEALAKEPGRLDALVNNAAIQINKPLVETTVEDWDETMAANLRSVYATARFAYPLLKKAAGAVVNVSSVHAMATSVNLAAYAASKGGILALTRAMSLEFGPDGIRVNSVLPGAVDTAMLRAGVGRGHLAGATVEEKLEELGKRTVLGRVGRPDEIARAIYFLCDSQQSSFVTGQALIVDGGASARLSTE